MSSLDELSAADRGFVTWLAGMLRTDVAELWQRVGGDVSHRPTGNGEPLGQGAPTTVRDGRLVALDLSVLGPAIRWVIGEERTLELPISGLDALEVLDCSGLGLDRLTVSLLPRLRHLSCHDNRLKELDLSSGGSLVTVDCGGNALLVLDARACSSLRLLRCGGNTLGALVLPEGGELEVLRCVRNQLMVLVLGDQPMLREVHAFRNALAQIDLGRSPRLEVLDCARNELDELHIPHQPALERLVASRNRLARVELSGASALQVIRLAGNYIDQIDVSHLHRLTCLELFANQLTRLAVTEHPDLVEIDVRDNRLEGLELAGAISLQVLRCAGNGLVELDLANLRSLCLVDCSENCLSTLDLSDAAGLAELRCEGNPITALDIRANQELCRFVSRGPRDGPVVVTATPSQRHRLRELRVLEGLGSGSSDLNRLDRWELHDLALSLKSHQTGRLLKVAQHPQCDLGTALLVYWTSRPHHYHRYETRDELEPYEVAGWDLIHAIEARFEADDFSTREVWFDPRNDKQTTSVCGHDWTHDDLGVAQPIQRPLPVELMQPSLIRDARSERTPEG